MLTDDEKRMIETFLSHYNTNCYNDARVHGELLRLYKSQSEKYDYARKLIMEKRKNWLCWYTINQFKWRDCDKNRHRDSFEIRERYIAPHVHLLNEQEFIKNARNYNKIRNPKLYEKI